MERDKINLSILLLFNCQEIIVQGINKKIVEIKAILYKIFSSASFQKYIK